MSKMSQSFNADIKGLMNIFSNSLYSDQDVFLRELISNSADAISKLRLKALESDLSVEEGKISLKVVDGYLEITDNGIGMTQEELDNLCTIARSGTQSFINSMDKDQQKQSQLIGKFGVGFYSVFMVASEVEVITKSAFSDKALSWVSDGSGYSVSDANKTDFGTVVRLKIKDEAKEFLETSTLERVVANYSQHLHIPVEILLPEGEPKVISEQDVIWHRSGKISDEDYNSFYKSMTYDNMDALTWVHQKVESSATDYTMLLYIPSQAPFDLYMKDRANGVKLYVKRIFIMSDPDKLMPSYLRFVRGVIDCQDLQLNVSRELLQSEKQLSGIRSGCVSKIISKIKKLSQDAEQYAKFWSNFGAVLKEGPTEDPNNAEKLYPLYRFASTKSDLQNVSLDDYISRADTEDKKIYYIIADSHQAAKSSPHLEYFMAKDKEVLLLSDKVDEWLMSQMMEYKGYKLQSVLQGDLSDVVESEKDNKPENTEYKDILDRLSKALDSKVKEVRSTERLVSSPCCLVSDSQDMSQHLKRLLEQAGQDVADTKPILELNFNHPLVKGVVNEQSEDLFNEWALLLFDQAQLLDGATLKDPSAFVHRLNKLLEPLIA